MIFNKVVFFVISLISFVISVSSTGLDEEFTWTRISYEWPKENELNTASRYSFGRNKSRPPRPSTPVTPIVFDGNTNNGQPSSMNTPIQQINDAPPRSIDYQYVNNIPMGANVWKDKLFITIPRRRLGVPSTLNYVPLNSPVKHNVPLRPYPNWAINLFPDTTERKENLVSVYRIAIDVCDRLWLVDTGIVETIANKTYVRDQHQLVVIDLRTDQIIHRYSLPNSVLTPASILSTLIVDVTPQTCDDAYVYFPDLAGYGVTVYSLKQDHSWRVNHNYFFVESLKGEFFIAGHNFQWNDGVFSIELSDVKPDGYRDMYFHALSGTHMFRVSTRIMRNETLATRSYHGHDFEDVGDRGALTQTSTADIHKPTGTMFMGLINQNALGCWNIHRPLNTLSIVQRDDQRMIYPSDVKVYGDKVYVLTNTMPEFLYGQLDYDKVNFRVWSNDVSSAVRGTMCQV